ncbi:MAG: potassium channel family protein, partial [Kitasatospora sp.]|jgi:hypothetical protein|nr:potassium channel family protein [Kitasatospora sp.]
MDYLTTAPFFANGQHASPQTFQYFSFTTLTTLGYGDFVAVNNGGRAVAVIEALAGQVFLATLVARLVAAFRGSAERAQSAATEQARPAAPEQAQSAATSRRPPRALRRPPPTSHRGRPAGQAARNSSGSRLSQPGHGDAVHSRAPRAGP